MEKFLVRTLHLYSGGENYYVVEGNSLSEVLEKERLDAGLCYLVTADPVSDKEIEALKKLKII